MSAPAATAQAGGSNAQMLITPDQFMSGVRIRTKPVANYQPYVDGGTVNVNMPQSGYGINAWVLLQFTIVLSGTVTGGTWAGWPAPAPWSIIQSMQYGNNNSTQIRNLSGIGWYLWLRSRNSFDMKTKGSTELYSSLTDTALGIGTSFPAPGSNIAAGTYTFNVLMPVPLSYNNMGDTGLLVQQANVVFYQLSLAFGNVTGGISATGGSNSIFTGLTGTGLSMTGTTGTYSVWYEYADFNPAGQPFTSMYMSANDLIMNDPNLGQNLVQIPNSQIYTIIGLHVSNNGAPVAPANLQALVMRHNSSILDTEDMDNVARAGRNYFMHFGSPPVDGFMLWDLGITKGALLRRDTVQAMNVAQITDLQINYTLPTTLTLTNPTARLITESLMKSSSS